MDTPNEAPHMRQTSTPAACNVQAMHSPLHDPAAWDALTAARRPAEILPSVPARSADPVVQARRAYLLMCNPATVGDGMTLMEQAAGSAPGRGMHLMVMAQLERHEEVVSSDYQRTGHSLLDCEDAVHAHAGLAVSCRALGRHMDAYGHIMIALEHARALGMTDRAQYLELFRHNVLGMTQRPDPDGAGRLLRAGMPATRRAFGLRGHADSIMALGDYRAALRALGPAATDDREAAGMRAWLTLLSGLPLLRPPTEDTQWGRLALRLQRVLEGRFDEQDAPELQQEPIRTYGRILTALSMSLGAGYDRRAQRTLDTAPERPDQRAAWTITRWIIDHRAGRHGALVQHVRAVEEACATLRCPRALLGLLASVVPDLYVLLHHSPARIDGLGEALTRVPVLLGDDVVVGGRRVRVAGRAGRVLVNEALGVPDDTLDPTEKRRMRNKLREQGVLCAPVNLGAVIATLRGAEHGDDPEWVDAVRLTMSQLTASVHEVMHHYPL